MTKINEIMVTSSLPAIKAMRKRIKNQKFLLVKKNDKRLADKSSTYVYKRHDTFID